MIDENVKNVVLNILDNLPSEGPCLDYKRGYPKNKKAELIKDVCGFLNSIDGLGQDKYIVIGVDEENNHYKLNKLNWNLWYKDDEIQGLMDKISPRPTVISDVIKYANGEEYAYLYMPGKINNDLVYSINTDYPIMSPSDPEFTKTKFVYATTSFIRRGSTTKQLLEEERRKIYESLNKKHQSVDNFKSAGFVGVKEQSIMKKLSLIGSWDDSNENDKKIVSKYFKMNYDSIIEYLNALLKNNPNIIEYKKNTWIFGDKFSIIKDNCNYFHDDDIKDFEEIVLKVESKKKPKYDLSNDKRQFAQWYGKYNKYSDTLRYSLMDTLLILKANSNELINCKKAFHNIEFTLLKNVVDVNDWKSIMSSADLLTYFAELDPDSYLAFNDELLKKDAIINQLKDESEDNFIRTNYLKEVIYGLNLIAQLDDYFIRSSVILIKLSEYDSSIIDNLATIMLPWMPQTMAPKEKRIIAVNNMYKYSKKMTLKLLEKLLPGRMSYSYEILKFKYCYKYEFEKPTYKDVYEEEHNIFEFCFEKESNNIEFLVNVVEDFSHLDGLLLDYVVDKIKNSTLKLKDYYKKYKIWNSIKNYLIKFKKYGYKESEGDIRKLKLLKTLETELFNKDYEYLRYFDENEWELEDEFCGDKNNLKSKRIKLATELYLKKNIEGLIEFSKKLKNSFSLGMALSESDCLNGKDYKLLISQLDSPNKNVVSLACGVVKYNLVNNKDYVIENEIKDMNNAQKTNFFLQMPNNSETWEKVENNLKYSGSYWKRNFVRFVKNSDELNYAAKMKFKYNLFSDAIDILYCGINKKFLIDMNLAFECLKKYLSKQDNIGSIQYSIKSVISYLQKNKYDEEKLFKLEWSYMGLLDEDCEPVTICHKIQSDPTVFMNLICLAYKKHNDVRKNTTVVNESIAQNAYYVLEKCKVIPGRNGDKVNKKQFDDWTNRAIAIANKEDRFDITKYLIGKMLFHSPADLDGLWINKTVASFINKEENEKVREGYTIEAFNSIGVINYDGTGSVYDNLAEEYKNKAHELEKNSYDVFAKCLYEYSKSLKLHVEHERYIY